MGKKRFKDPIYGYIDIEDDLITQVVDSSGFQRLRDIIQTSYSPLYASAVHNRFVHSIGVYHLGNIASAAFRSKDILVQIPEINQYIDIFKLACLLHDVGHAPFSHTGEKHYLYKGERNALHTRLIALTEDDILGEEIKKNGYKAAPHELMSAILSLEDFGELIPKKMRSFFARCITGYKYESGINAETSVLNCLIELLNSKIIDVDKLDYLIRDSYMTGFDTVKIDYIRLLNSIRIVKDEKDFYQVCYYKTAVSVIENAVYAHDAERKWIQNHPIVLYEVYLLDNIIAQIIKTILQEEYLDEKYLKECGENIKNYGKICLLSDADIIYLMKNLHDDAFAKEYYGRRYRKHPIWKSEAEFQAIFLDKSAQLLVIEEEIKDLTTYLRSLGLPFVINRMALEEAVNDLSSNKKMLEQEQNADEANKLKVSVMAREKHVKFMKIWERFSEEAGIEFEFLIIHADQFNSGFRKQEFGNIDIILPELQEPCKLKEISNVLQAQQSKAERFFYVYYTRKNEEHQLSIAELRREMLTFANEVDLERGNRKYN